MASRLACTMACVMAVLACAGNAPPSPAPENDQPVIDKITPTSGPAGIAYPIRLTIQGRHFADSTNTVSFGSVQVVRATATDAGTRIVLYLPKERSSGGEAPPMVLEPGVYPITVSTRAGKSNAVLFTLTREP